MKKILIILTVLLIISFVGCDKVHKQPENPAANQSDDSGSSQSTSQKVNESGTVQFYNEKNSDYFCSKDSVPYSCDEKCFIKIYNYSGGKIDTFVSPYSLNPWTNIEHTKELIDSAAHKNISSSQRIRILFYGQSISDGGNLWVTDYLPDSLTEKYGDIFNFSIKSRGGWFSTALFFAYHNDVKMADPDLVIIQDYSDYDGSYEALLFDGCNNKTKLAEWFNKINSSGNFPSIQKADFEDNLGNPGIRQMVNSRGNNVEVLLLSDHYSLSDKNEKKLSDCMSFVVYPRWANEHGLGFADIRIPWINYIMTNYGNISDSTASNLLKDYKHLNDKGQELYAGIVLKYFGIDFDKESSGAKIQSSTEKKKN